MQALTNVSSAALEPSVLESERAKKCSLKGREPRRCFTEWGSVRGVTSPNESLRELRCVQAIHWRVRERIRGPHWQVEHLYRVNHVYTQRGEVVIM